MENFTINGDKSFEENEVEVEEVLSTPLMSLKDRRKKILDELFIDIQVPRWDEPEIFVRFKPVSALKLNASIERRRKRGGDDWSLLANADVLVDSCIGVYAVMSSDKEQHLSLRPGAPKSPWTKFDSDLADALGADVDNAADTCIALYLTEGDLIETANKLFRWSNIANDEADATF